MIDDRVRRLVSQRAGIPALAAILRVAPEDVAGWAAARMAVPARFESLVSSWDFLVSQRLRVDFDRMARELPPLEAPRAASVLGHWVVIADRLRATEAGAARPLSWLVWRTPQAIHVRSYRGETFSFLVLPGGVPAVESVLDAADRASLGAFATDALWAALRL